MSNRTLFVRQLKAGVAVTAAGYATYFNSKYAYKLPEGMEGYVFGESLQKVYNAGDIVPMGTPLVLKAEQNNYLLDFAIGGTAPASASQLHGSDAATMTDVIVPGEYKYYGLSLNDAGDPYMVGFYWMADGGIAFENGAHKAFLAVPVTSGGSEAPAILFNENGATNVETIKAQEGVKKFIENGRILIEKNGITYDAMGRIVK